MRGAEAIARDPTRLAAAAAFWRQAFGSVGITDLSALAHDAISLGEHLPDEWFWRLMPARERLVSGCDHSYLVKRSGCLVSLDEIARTVSSTLTGTELLAYVSAVLAAGTPGAVVPAQIAASGLIAARELFDLLRRFQICSWNGQEFGIPASELLSLYRQEGALCLAPSRQSYRHAPLIRTGFGCREESVSLFDQTCARPGFNLVYKFMNSTDAQRTDPSVRFDLLFRNLVTLAGLDTVLLPGLSPGDELRQLWAMASSGSSPSEYATLIKDTYRKRLGATATLDFNRRAGKTQRQFLDDLCIGLARALLDPRDAPPPHEELFNNLWLSVASLFSAHSYEPARPWPGGDVRLSADLDASDAYTCLRLQARWYASRRDLRTLLAWEDRPAKAGVPRRFNPFMTYLRFHAGDALFVGLLLRVIARFNVLVKTWETNSAMWGSAFLDSIPAPGWDATKVADLAVALRNHWATRRVTTETSWHHIGLIHALLRHTDPPAWLGAAKPANPNLRACARVVARLVEVLEQPGILDVVSAAMEFTPALWLAGHGFTPLSGPQGTNLLVKSHSFERLRLAYAQAALDAGVE